MQKCSGSQRQTHLQACHRLEAASLTASSVIECSEAWADSHSVASFRCGETSGHCCSCGGAPRVQRPLCCACVVESEAVTAKRKGFTELRKTRGEPGTKKAGGKGKTSMSRSFGKQGADSLPEVAQTPLRCSKRPTPLCSSHRIHPWWHRPLNIFIFYFFCHGTVNDQAGPNEDHHQ